MSIFDDISRFGAALRTARRNRIAIRQMNELPPELQKDIGWPGTAESRSSAYAKNAWKTLI
jgi:hypothetical protein